MTRRLLLITGVILGLALSPVFAASIVGSKHDLSTSGYWCTVGGACWNTEGPAVSDEICVFCHTPHGSNNDLNNDVAADGANTAPLWNKRITNTGVYQVYTSPTMNATCAATPSPVSLACLSCHDGRTAGGIPGEISASTKEDGHNTVNPSNRAAGATSGVNCGGCHGALITIPAAQWRIGANLSDDHPISIDYQAAHTGDRGLHAPTNWTTGWSDIKLYNGRVECPTCHNVHDPSVVPFLRRTMDGSALCLACHNK